MFSFLSEAWFLLCDFHLNPISFINFIQVNTHIIYLDIGKYTGKYNGIFLTLLEWPPWTEYISASKR